MDYLEREREEQRCNVEKSVEESKSYGSVGGVSWCLLEQVAILVTHNIFLPPFIRKSRTPAPQFFSGWVKMCEKFGIHKQLEYCQHLYLVILDSKLSFRLKVFLH